MATLRLVFRVSKIQQYSENFVQDLLSAGLSSSMHGKPLEVPEFGQIDAVILLGSKAVTSLCVSPESLRLLGVTKIVTITPPSL